MAAVADTIEFAVTPRIEQACVALAAALTGAKAQRSEFARISAIGRGKRGAWPATLSLADVKTLSRELREHGLGDGDVWVHQLLRGSRIHIEQPAPKPRNPELVARLDKIKQQLEEQEYVRMVSGITHHGFTSGTGSGRAGLLPAVPGVRAGQPAAGATIRQDLRDVNKSVSVIVNILFSALGVGFAVGYASYALTSEIGWRVLMALGAAAAIVLAEAWLYAFSGSRGQKKRLFREAAAQ